MIIRRAFMENLRRPEFKRKYVVPVTGQEYNDHVAYAKHVKAKTTSGKLVVIETESDWPCSFQVDEVGVPDTSLVFRFPPDAPDSKIITIVKKGLQKARSLNVQRPAIFPEDATIIYKPPYDKDQW